MLTRCQRPTAPKAFPTLGRDSLWARAADPDMACFEVVGFGSYIVHAARGSSRANAWGPASATQWAVVEERVPPGKLRIAVAPNAYKGTLGAEEACRAISEGLAQLWPQAELAPVPMADGGDGFLPTLVAAGRGRIEEHLVQGPLLEPVSAPLGWLGPLPRETAVVELAGACGLRLLAQPGPETAARSTTLGLGQLIALALGRDPIRILVGIGGSASTDGGSGMARALGFRFLDQAGRELGPGGLELLRLDRIEPPSRPLQLQGTEVVAACDVDNPLLGERGAAAFFGPQKGADPELVARLERALARLAELVRRDLGTAEMARLPGMGAAGGTGFGLAAFLGAQLSPGVSLVADAAGLDQALEGAQLAITGEGRFDQGSLHGKATGEVLRRARARGLPTLILCGSAEQAAVAEASELGGTVFANAKDGSPPADREHAHLELRALTERAGRELGDGLLLRAPEPRGGARQ